MTYQDHYCNLLMGKLIKTEQDLNWLKIHGANMFGIKQDFQTKIDWVNNNLKTFMPLEEIVGQHQNYGCEQIRLGVFLLFAGQSIFINKNQVAIYVSFPATLIALAVLFSTSQVCSAVK